MQRYVPRTLQKGLTLIELMTVIGIIAIMAYTGVPYFKDMMVSSDLNTANRTLMQALQKAKYIARAENTIVNVSISNNVITLTPGNTSSVQTLKMPSNINVSSDVTFSFNPMGLAIENGNNINANKTITIESTADETINKNISITTTGLIAAL